MRSFQLDQQLQRDRPAPQSRLRGFTLLEMLVVILIIGLLTGIVAPRLLGQMATSEITAARAQLAAIDKALQAFRIDNKRFPTTQEGLAALTIAPSSAPQWAGPYLQSAVGNDPWGQPYQYAFPGRPGRDYDLYSSGPSKTGAADGSGGAVFLNSGP
ncbi:type II secretion system major pseudopilin GspG [Roseateles sp.]|uniref:type II secretion system major pseudopilin GspG n=1 Tax=Roseateles sp. TaxID=1971397 RepID=UPI0039E7B642